MSEIGLLFSDSLVLMLHTPIQNREAFSVNRDDLDVD